MKELLILLLLLSFSSTASGQHELGLKVNAGISRITSSINSTSVDSYSTSVVQNAPSAQVGVFYNFQIGHQSTFGAELLFNRVLGKEETMTELFINREIVGMSTTDLDKRISYLSLPIYYEHRFHKLGFNVGFQVSVALSSSGREKGQATISGDVTTWDNNFDELNIDLYDYGPRAGILYKISDKLSIEGTCYYGLNNILASERPISNWQVRKVNLGIRYTLKERGENEKFINE